MKFKNVGKSLNSVERNKFKKKSLEAYEKPIGIDFPLRSKSNKNETLFGMTYNLNDQIKVNLLNLLTTTKGEFICNPEFGTTLSYLYNQTNIENVDEVAMNDIKSAIDAFMPFVTLKEFYSEKIAATQESSGYNLIKVKYEVDNVNISNEITIKIKSSR